MGGPAKPLACLLQLKQYLSGHDRRNGPGKAVPRCQYAPAPRRLKAPDGWFTMPAFLVNWLDRLSAGQLLALFCVFFLGVAWFGIAAIHPRLRRHLHGDEPSNEVIIFSAANFGPLYAVLLGLLTIATFQTTKDVVDTIGREASSLPIVASRRSACSRRLGLRITKPKAQRA